MTQNNDRSPFPTPPRPPRQEELHDGAEETKRLQEAKDRLQQRMVELAAELVDEKVRGWAKWTRQ